MQTLILPLLDDILASQADKVTAWFDARFTETPALPYASVDLRHSGVKIAPVDTNLFSAGFNNISRAARGRASERFKTHLARVAPDGRRLLIVPENHTRNLHYLENVRVLAGIIEEAGWEVRLGSLMYDLDEAMVLETATGADIRVEPLRREDGRIGTADGFVPDVVLMNNDMTAGAPSILVDLEQPVIPPLSLGWYRRRKSGHFSAYAQVADAFAEEFDIDPWLVQALWHQCGQINFREKAGLGCVARGVDKVLHLTREKYRQYGIESDPYVFVKAGHKMNVIKEGALNTEVIVQEGVPTVDLIEGESAEPVIYLVDGRAVGGFYRVNKGRGEYDSLNAMGAYFTQMCDEVEPRIEPAGNGGDAPCPFRVFGVLGSLAALAAAREQVI
jgi:glutamate--cysteine ligase